MMFLLRIKVILVILFIKWNLNHELASARIVNFTIENTKQQPYNPENGMKLKDDKKVHDGMDKYCLNSECIHTASRVSKFMDSSVDPCDNFYKFSCGQFIKTREIPDNRDAILSFDLVQDAADKFMKNFLEKEVKPTDPKHAKLAKNLYQSCMNTTVINERSLPAAVNMLKKMGGWPLLEGDAWKEDGFQWEKFMFKVVEETGLTIGFFSTYITFDEKNSSKYILEIDQPTFFGTSPSDYYNFLVDIAVIFGADKIDEAELKQIHKIEMDLLNISEDEEMMSEFSNKMTVKELKGNYSNILWKEYFNVIMYPYHEIGDDEIIQVRGRSFFEKFNKLIERIPKRDQANFIIWKVVDRMTDYLNDDVQKAEMKLIFATTGQKKMTPRSIDCYNFVGESLQHGVSAIYIQNYFNKDSKKDVTEIINIILEQLEINIQNAEWLDNKTKKLALEKITSIHAFVAYADEFLDGEKIDNYYKELEINSESFLQAFANITKFKRLDENNYLRKLVNRTNWIHRLHSRDINAAYNPFLNMIDVQAGILNGIFYNNKIPKYMNYGGIGSVLGHEISHSVDVVTSNFDKDGNIVDWWAPASKKEFLKRAQCFIHQYGNYIVEEVGLKLDASKMQEENIADSEGIKIAYLAYMRWVKNHDPEYLLPGLNYTQSQLFWISNAQLQCAKMTPKKLENNIKYNFHSPPEFRVIGSLSNQPEFARDFNCAKGTNMNPENKCSIW